MYVRTGVRIEVRLSDAECEQLLHSELRQAIEDIEVRLQQWAAEERRMKPHNKYLADAVVSVQVG